jgi:predicted transcriptional regulator YdeE
MEYRVVTKPGFTLLGLMKRFPYQEDDFEGIWKRFMAYEGRINPLSIDKAYYGAYYPTVDSGPMDYLAGMLVEGVQEPPKGLTVCEVPEARWAVFTCTVATIGQTYDTIFKEWLPKAPYEHAGPNPDAFERYPPQRDSGDTPVLVHIKIRDKETTT